MRSHGHNYILAGALVFLAACSSDKSTPGVGDDSDAVPTAEPAKAAALPLTPVGKPAAELEAEGWKAVQVSPEHAARLRDTSRAAPGLRSLALRRELQALNQTSNAPSFDSSFADTVRMIEQVLMRMSEEWRNDREAEIVDSLKRVMGPRDPDLDAASVDPKLLQSGLQAPAVGNAPAYLATFSEEPWSPGVVPPIELQQSQTSTIHIAPGVEGTKITSADGSSTTTEVGFKQGNMESSVKTATSSPDEFERRGEIGFKIDATSTKRGKVEGAAKEEIELTGFERRLGYCPDAGGLVKGKHSRWEQSSTVMTVGSTTINHGFELRSDYTLTVSVDDNARAQEIVVEGTSVLKLSAGARGGGNARPTLKDIRADLRWQKGVDDNGLVGSMYWRFSSAVEADRRFDDALRMGLIIAMDEAEDLAKQAERRWRNGACIEVIPHPEKKALRFGGKTTFRIEVKHKRDGSGSFPYPVRMMAKKEYTYIDETLGQLEPQGTLTAPANFQYTAPGKGTPEGQRWRGHPGIDRAYPMSISRRGIGMNNFYARYDSLRRTFRVTYHQRVETQKGGVGNEVQYRAVVRERDEPDQDGNTFAGTGDYKVLVNLKPANCSFNKLEGVEQIAGGGSLKAGASINPSWTGSNADMMTFDLTPQDGPKMRFFTRSFTELEKMHSEDITQDGEEAPLLAPNVVGWVELRERSSDSTHVFSMGTSPCEGPITGTNVARVERLR